MHAETENKQDAHMCRKKAIGDRQTDEDKWHPLTSVALHRPGIVYAQLTNYTTM